MTAGHPDIGPELRKLVLTILDAVDPAVRATASRASSGAAAVGSCQQVWCPVCALAALAAGEQHPLLTVVAEHSVGLLAVIRAIVDDVESPPPDGPPAPGAAAEPPADPVATSRYQQITVTVEE
ncbi:hypothetical protein [Mycobacterium sp.]|uniref:hypothetical protein n=1 Tax=Mycobacterium sp. TaxID=1785 RepID=UPI0031DCB105